MNMIPGYFVLLSFIIVSSKGDPITELNQCLEKGQETKGDCLKILVLSLKDFMKTGIPEAGVAPLDPLKLDNVGFNLAGASIDFMNITLDGMSDHQVGGVSYNEASREMSLTLNVPKLNSAGRYSLTGKVLNIDGLDSQGPYKNQYTGITTKASGKIVKRGNNIEVGEMNIELDIDNINVHLECLFPKPGGPNCCEKDRKFKSCNPILAKTIHRTINTKTAGGESSILKRFQKEITGKVADVVRGILNSALSSVDSKYFF